jgi:hypothetical protein
MATHPPDRRPTVPVTPDDEHGTYHPGTEVTPDTPSDEVRQVSRGERSRTPFVLIGSMQLLIYTVVAIVIAIVVLAMWLAV